MCNCNSNDLKNLMQTTQNSKLTNPIGVLRRLFPPLNVFYFLSPFSTHLEFIQEQSAILGRSYAVDAHMTHHLLTNLLSRSKTRTVRVRKSDGEVLFTGNRKRRTIRCPLDIDFFCRHFSSHGIGHPSGSPARGKNCLPHPMIFLNL